MNDNNKPVGARFWKPDHAAQDSSARLFVPLDATTLAWLTERAAGRPVGTTAAEVLRALAEAEAEGEG